jgi:hypothetical protein
MKMLSFAIVAMTMLSQVAMAKMTNQEFRGSVTGKVKFEQKWTATCAALGCPPSRPYTQISLVNANVEGYGKVDSVVISNENNGMFPANAQSATVKGTRLRPGLKVRVNGTTLVRTYSFIETTTAYFNEIVSIKVVR